MTITRHRITATVGVDHFDVTGTLFASAWPVSFIPTPGPPPGWTVTAPATAVVGRYGPEVTYTTGGGDFRRQMTEVPANSYYRTTFRVIRVGPIPAGDMSVRVIVADIGDLTAWSPLVGPVDVTVDAYNGGPAGTRGLVRLELWNGANTARQSGTVRVLRVTVEALTRTQYLELHPEEASVTMDESWAPYVQAQVVCPMPDPSALPDLDPRKPRRVVLTLHQSAATAKLVKDVTALWSGRTAAYVTATYTGKTAAWFTDLFGDPLNDDDLPAFATTRAMNLHLRERSLDYVAATMTLVLASDEALAQDFGRVNSTDVASIPPATTDLRTLVAWGINLVGGWLDSASTTAVIATTPLAGDWALGQSIWEYLDPFVTAAGLRLRCDETRVWHLEAPPDGSAGAVTIGSVTGLDDVLTREGWGDTVVLRHHWANAGGTDTTSFAASTNLAGPVQYTKSILVEKTARQVADTVAADALFARVKTRGRQVRLRAVNDYRVVPGVKATIDTVVTTIPPVLVSAVTWAWPDDEMNVTTRDLP